MAAKKKATKKSAKKSPKRAKSAKAPHTAKKAAAAKVLEKNGASKKTMAYLQKMIGRLPAAHSVIIIESWRRPAKKRAK